ncbi:MAG: tetratricopeptide repeat protein, partial [Armatimonadetes bacterium]|nr:tetratricopeptide repeat protein [Armatimonadota bacterium]MDW8123032.1 tetratricopeptide repeat protein [Armatimonadota bacterium]
QLPPNLQEAFSEVLKDEKHRGAWVAFQKDVLTEVLSVVKSMRQQLIQLSEEERRRFEELQRRLETLAGVPEILSFLCNSVLTILSGVQTLQERMDSVTQTHSQILLEMIRVRERTDQIEKHLRTYLGSEHLVISLNEFTGKFLTKLAVSPFVGRQGPLDQLNNFVSEGQGVAIVYAPPGYGKTRLIAHWISQIAREEKTRVVYHFFNRDPVFEGHATTLRDALKYVLAQVRSVTGQEDAYMMPRDEVELRLMLRNVLANLSLNADERLVIVLDGLDEAEPVLEHPPLPDPLPRGLFFVVSGRWDGTGPLPKYFEGWARFTEYIPLKALSLDELKEWLVQKDDGVLSQYAEDEEFVQELRHKTDGLPLFVTYLLDDLVNAAKQNRDVREVLRRTPAGLQGYINGEFEQMARVVKNEPGVRKMFALLTVAKGAMQEREIGELTGLSSWDFADLPIKVTRWFSIGEERSVSTEEEYSERTYIFAHPLLAEEFRRVLGREAQEAEIQLLNWCGKWREHKSPYALRFYPVHLREQRERFADLFELMRDKEFTQTQREVIPHEPDLPLRTIQLALQAAIEEENPVVMAEAVLRHASLVETKETPLQALKVWGLDRALGLARQRPERDYQMGTLWLLFLAWERSLSGDSEGAEKALETIVDWWHGKKLAPLGSIGVWRSGAAVYFLRQLVGITGATEVAIRVLDDKGLRNLSASWAQWGRLDEALQVAERIEDQEACSRGLMLIGIALAQAGQDERALRVFEQAVTVAESIESWWRWSALTDIVTALAESGLLEEALSVAERIEDDWERSHSLTDIAIAVAKKGRFDEAVAVAERIDAPIRSIALKDIATDLAQAGRLEEALTVARMIDNDSARARALMDLGTALAQVGRRENVWKVLDGVLRAAEEVKDDSTRLEVLSYIAETLTEAGMREKAEETFKEAWRLEDKAKSWALWVLSLKKTASSGFDDLALSFAQRILGKRERLAEVVEALAEGGAKGAVLRLLPLCGWLMPTALAACLALTRLYPEKAFPIAQVVIRHLRES